MELILKEDVENLGFKDDLVVVKNGYGRNFLIPQGKAILATISAKKVLSENDKLFGSVTNSEISKELFSKGFEFEKKSIQLSSTIKKIGSYTAKIRLHREVYYDLNFEVISSQS